MNTDMTGTVNPGQGAEGSGSGATYRTTRHFSYPLPPALAPHRELKWKDGGVNVADPTGNAPTKKARMVMDTSIARLLGDTAGLMNYAYRDAVGTIARDQTLLQPVLVALSQGDETSETIAINNLVTRVTRRGFGASSREWATALFEWMDYIDYGGTEPVHPQFSPFVEAYYRTISRHGWTFDEELSHRYVTRAGERGVLPLTPVISNTNRVYRDRNGNPVSLRATTAKNPSTRIAETVGAAGFASTATQILGKGSKSIWHKMEPELGWERTRFGMIHISRNLVPGQLPDVTLHGFDTGVALDLAQSALNSYEIQHNPLAVRAASTGAFNEDLIVEGIVRSTTVEEISALYSHYEDQWTSELTELGNRHIAESLGIAPLSPDEKEQ